MITNKRTTKQLILSALLISALPYLAVASENSGSMPTYLGMQGYSGTLNTPNAFVSEEGSIHFQYSNEKNRIRGKLPRWQDNYMLSIGFFNFAEIGGRLTYNDKINDLSANVKLTTAPLKAYSKWIPNIAIGVQDMGGGAHYLENRYIVMSEDIWRLRLSGGYGFGSKSMKGGFAGGELRVFDWLHLLGEYETKDFNIGGRLVTPPMPYLPVSLTFTAMKTFEDRPKSFSMGFGFTLPLGGSKKTDKYQRPAITNLDAPLPAPERRQEPKLSEPPPLPYPWTTSVARTDETKAEAKTPQATTTKTDEAAQAATKSADIPMQGLLQQLLAKLGNAGFINLQVGLDEDKNTLVVEYENTRYNHNELDALGVVTGITLQHTPADVEQVAIIIKRKGIKMLLVNAPASTLRSFMQDNTDIATLRQQITISTDTKTIEKARFIDGDNRSGFLQTSLVLQPGLSTWVGTDYGPFDYLLSMRPEIFTNLWSGAVVSARWNIPVAWSDNLDDGKPYRKARNPSQLDRLMLFQGVKLLPGVMLNLGGGKLTADQDGTMNELVWQPWDGSHRIRLSQTWAHNRKTKANTTSYLAAYRYYFSPFDLSFEATGGRFRSQDEGYRLELKRYFGDASVNVFYKNTNIREQDRRGLPKHWEAAGLELAFPLTFGRDMKPMAKIQLRGTDEWSYAQQSVIAGSNKNNANYLPPVALAISPVFTGSLHNQYLNRDRLNESYLREHLDRLREAWGKYGKDAESTMPAIFR